MGLRCAFCHSSGEALTSCAACGTQLHPECWADSRSCPTLGCVGFDATHVRPGPKALRGSAGSSLRSACLGLSIGIGLSVGGLAMLVGGFLAKNWIGAPRIEVRNDSRRVLSNVTLRGFQLDAGERTVHAKSLAPGESITLSGEHTDYELNVDSLTFDDGKEAVGPAYDLSARMRFRAVPWARSILAVDSQDRLRTVVDAGSWGRRAVPCTCPDGNAARTGSSSCSIEIHAHDFNRARAASARR